MVDQAHFAQLAQHQAKADQDFSTETSFTVRLQVIVYDCFEMRKFPPSTIHRLKSAKRRKAK